MAGHRSVWLGVLMLAGCGAPAAGNGSSGTIAVTDATPPLDTATDIDDVADVPAIADAPMDAGALKSDVAPGPTPEFMALVPAGTFWMGCNSAKQAKCWPAEEPRHKVTLSAYYMDVYETTVTQYKACVDAGACTAPAIVQPAEYATYPGLKAHPVNNVTWTQMRQYCMWRGKGFDLPTEAQWEMAARGGCDQNGAAARNLGCAEAMWTYPWGDAPASCAFAVMYGASPTSQWSEYGCGSKSTWEVGLKPAGDSPFGIHDMAGNVDEWVRDGFVSPYSADEQTDPVESGTNSDRVVRGGSFLADPVYQYASLRAPLHPSDAFYGRGGRCSKTYP